MLIRPIVSIVLGMKPYSQDLRDRIITALEAGTETQRAIAERFGVRGSFVEKCCQRWRRSGSRAAKPHAGWTWDRVVRRGEVVEQMLDVGTACSADFIVLTTQGHQGFLDALRGSTSERLLRRARCPGLAVPAT